MDLSVHLHLKRGRKRRPGVRSMLLMLLMLTILAMALTAMIVAPETPLGRAVRRMLVEAPAAWLTRHRARLIYYALLGLVGLMLFDVMEMEGVRLFAMLAPEAVGWFALFDVGLFIDAALVALAAASAIRFGPLRDRVKALVQAADHAVTGRVRRAARAARTRIARAVAPRRSDDPDPAGWTQPAFG